MMNLLDVPNLSTGYGMLDFRTTKTATACGRSWIRITERDRHKTNIQWSHWGTSPHENANSLSAIMNHWLQFFLSHLLWTKWTWCPSIYFIPLPTTLSANNLFYFYLVRNIGIAMAELFFQKSMLPGWYGDSTMSISATYFYLLYAHFWLAKYEILPAFS